MLPTEPAHNQAANKTERAPRVDKRANGRRGRMYEQAMHSVKGFCFMSASGRLVMGRQALKTGSTLSNAITLPRGEQDLRATPTVKSLICQFRGRLGR